VEDRLLREIIHIAGHIVIYSLVLWQFVLGVWLILKWVNKNWKIKKTFSVVSPTENKTQTVQPVINIDGASIGEGIAKKKKDMGPVDVDVNRNVFIDKIEGGRVEMDEVKKGKVKTQKDKLKKLRGK
jgi:hypothetical protein